ncbi:MAG: MarC family protein [Bdellovibrionales bacterium]|nr:MarC family protein [Bdellovibrionales bacterium]
MAELFNSFLLVFIPTFIAMDSVGVLPYFIGVVQPLPKEKKNAVLLQAVLTAGVVGIGFVFLGNAILDFLGITISDFRIAGGLILLILSIHDLISPEKTRRKPSDTVGVVPLGMPLIMGPAVLTTIIVSNESVGIWMTLSALLANLFITFIIFSISSPFIRFLGDGGAKALSKLANILLAAFALMIIRVGLVDMIETYF